LTWTPLTQDHGDTLKPDKLQDILSESLWAALQTIKRSGVGVVEVDNQQALPFDFPLEMSSFALSPLRILQL